MSLRDISYLQLWWPQNLAERDHLCYFGRGYYEEHFCEIIFIQEIFIIYSSGGPYIWWSGTIHAILVESIMRNISVKLL